MSNLIPFDIEKAKAGVPVVMRNNTPVRIICYDAIGEKPIVFLVNNERSTEEYIYKARKDGLYAEYECTYMDLFHPEPEMYVNVYESEKNRIFLHHSLESANEGAGSRRDLQFKGTYKLVKI